MSILTNLFRTQKSYCIIFFGRYPKNITQILTPILSPNKPINYVFSQSCLLIHFNSKQTKVEIKKHIINCGVNSFDSFYIFNQGETLDFYRSPYMQQVFDSQVNERSETGIIRIQGIINEFYKARDGIMAVLTELKDSIENGNMIELEGGDLSNIITKPETGLTDEERLNKILDEINSKGIDSLNNEDKEFLKKYNL
jgi:hypothetical protein